MRLFGRGARVRRESGVTPYGRVRSPRSVRTVPAGPLRGLADAALRGADRPRELELYRELRRLLPLVDVAIHRLVRLVGYVRIEADASLVPEIERFLSHVQVNGLQRGFDSFLANHVGQMLQYGYAAGEMVPESGQRGIRALVNLDSRYVHVIEDDPPLGLAIGYQPPGAGQPVRVPKQLALWSVNAPEGESPYGTSLLRSLPFVAHILLTMERALQQTWERMGAPSYQVTWEPPEGFVDPDGDRTREVMEGIEASFTEAMQARQDSGLVRDFFAAGAVRVGVIGADGAQLEFRETYRALTEQIVARTGLPPYMLGLAWSSTERMSTQQADMVISEVKDFRRELEPMVEKVIELWLALTRRRGRFRVRWSEVSLQDLKDAAEAAHRRALARKLDVEALGAMVDRGWIDARFAREQLFPAAQYEAMDEPAETTPPPAP